MCEFVNIVNIIITHNFCQLYFNNLSNIQQYDLDHKTHIELSIYHFKKKQTNKTRNPYLKIIIIQHKSYAIIKFIN